ncbi:phosphate ABC transporter substrate-binding protein PstS [Edaphobacter sp.]|uniref:phosphate ABC transporter substrate-binding protein PstS n=1 Tax=Edaphobacter sp. TaxID=1934404 RepID=UPI002DBDA947|nr:phosphate ABC transporter substrate-binding protein PstS [Edaphobacter sp.]HEU5339788.1 phosphate ABC transporter substrate-binding protein PstS [Edaphobacter sp.]
MNTSSPRSGRIIAAITALALTAALTACKSSGPTTQSVTLNGAGSTFVNPAMSRWTYDFAKQNPGLNVNYQSIGSGGGVQQVKSGTVDFGASDYAIADKDLATMKPVLQIPETAGPVCITYNLPGVTQPLQLSAEAIAGIFLGKITTWHDPILQKDNPGVALPNIKIVVAHRTDGSGTTAAFTTYLSAVSPEWAAKVGSGGAVSWPVGLGGKGSEGVTAQVRQSPGGIGYVELIYAQQNKLAIASVRNQAGKYVAPSEASTTAAIVAFNDQLNKDPRLPIVNAPASAPDAYPISTLTFLIVPKDGTDAAKRSALKKFIQYIVTSGQAAAGALNYAPLPDGVKQYDQDLINQMTVNGQPVQ